MEARLPKEKVVRICEILHTFKHKKSCSKRELLSLLGHLNFARRVIRPGRSFVAYLINLSTTVKELHHHVKLSQDVRLDLDMWLKFLSGWNGVSFFLDDDITTNADMHLFTDATDKSFGGIYHNQWFQGEFPVELLKENDTMSMALFELYPIVVACVLWGKQWKKLRIVFHCDNMSTVQIINKGRSKGKTIMKLMRKLTWCSATFNFTIHAQHVPGSLNSVADAISRFQMDRFRRLASLSRPQANLPPSNTGTSDVLGQIDDLWRFAISPGTTRAYKTALNTFLKFLTMNNVVHTPGVLPPSQSPFLFSS